jgi:hypothetical protein
MQITLRKANAVQNSINEMIKGLKFETSVQLNEFEVFGAQIEAVRNEFFTHSATRGKLACALYTIRKAVARANAGAGINDMLADVAMLEKEIQHNNTYATKAARLSDAVIEGKLEKIRNTKEEVRMYGRGDTIDTGIFTKEEVDGFKSTVADLKRQKQTLQDTLLELNVQTVIELDEETERFLAKAGIL